MIRAIGPLGDAAECEAKGGCVCDVEPLTAAALLGGENEFG
jgi:hypothetical protein